MHMQRLSKRPQFVTLCHNHHFLNYLYTRLIYLFTYCFSYCVERLYITQIYIF
jgi:hypothetical protein